METKFLEQESILGAARMILAQNASDQSAQKKRASDTLASAARAKRATLQDVIAAHRLLTDIDAEAAEALRAEAALKFPLATAFAPSS